MTGIEIGMINNMKNFLLLIVVLWATSSWGANFVITVSMDGAGAGYLQSLMEEGKLPALQQLMNQGACTTNARADYSITVTLPNHATMLTSRPITGDGGHAWISNTSPSKGTTLHSNKGEYVASAFDVAHDNGRRTGLWTTKSKFALFAISYDAEHGAFDTIGTDNGRNKVDVFCRAKKATALTDNFIELMATNPCHYSFIHFGDTDSAGHEFGWGSKDYRSALIAQDTCVGRIMQLMTNHPAMKNHSTLIITADHGGTGIGHGDSTDPLNYTIPFCVWGAGVSPGDLYTLNAGIRALSGSERPDYSALPQPVRNGDAGNLGLSLLGLGPIPNSSINNKQDLQVAPTPTHATQ